MRLGDCYIGRLRRAEEIWQESSIIKVAGCGLLLRKVERLGFRRRYIILGRLGRQKLSERREAPFSFFS